MSHTPGPWKVEVVGSAGPMDNPFDLCEIQSERSCVAESVLDRDAALIAAAPDLLEALKALVRYTEACEGLLNASPAGQVLNAHAAIAKAEGK